MKRRNTKNMPKGLAAYWRKKQRKKTKSSSKKHKRKASHPVAKKKRRKGTKGRRRRSHGGGGGSAFPALGLPSKDKMYDMAGSAAYGWLESKAKAEADFFLNKIPRPIDQLGFAGGTALAAFVLNKYGFKSKWLMHLANGAANAAMYQMGRKGELFTSSSEIFTISGDDDIAGYLDDDQMGALAAEGEYIGDDDDIGDDGDMVGDDEMEGIPTMGVD